MKTKKATAVQFGLLGRFRYLWPELVKVSNSLHRISEKDCNYGLTSRDEKRRERLEQKAEELAARVGLKCYFQRDPRGCSLYLIMDGQREYNGIAVY